MTSFGSGVGGDLGTPPSPTQEHLKATSWTETNKAALLIVKDSIDVPLSQLGFQNAWKYLGSEAQPSLDHPLESLRMAGEPPGLGDESWRSLYDQFIQTLPDDPPGNGIKSRYLNAMNTPFEQRDGTYTALDNLFTATAKILTRLEGASTPVDEQSLVQENTIATILRPYVALQKVSADGPHLMQALQKQMGVLGPNYPHFDALSAMNTNLEDAFHGLQQLNELIRQDPTASVTKEYAAKLAQNMNAVNAKIQSSYAGEELTYIKAAYQSITHLANALSVADTSIPSLYLALQTTTTPNGNPLTSLPGPVLGSLMEAMVDGLAKGLMPDMDAAHRGLLSGLAMNGIASFAAFAGIIAQGYGNYPSQDPVYLADAREFAFDIALHMIGGLGVMEGFFTQAVEAAGTKEERAKALVDILKGTAFLFMILAGSNQLRESSLPRLLTSHRETLLKGLETAENLFSEENDNEAAQAAAIALQQARMELEKNNIEGFLAAFTAVLELNNATPEGLKENLRETHELAETAIQASSHRPDDQVTRVITVV